MPRIRTIKPDLWANGKIARVSRDARLLFLGLITESDDEGRLLGSPKRLAGVLFPHDSDVTATKLARWMRELSREGLARCYAHEGVEYVELPGFNEHQRISHATPSRLPPPDPDAPEMFPGVSGISPEDLRPDLGSRNKDLGRGRGNARAIPDPFDVTPEMIEWVEREHPAVDWQGETRKFLDHFRANGKPMKDWGATWRNWIRRSVDFAR